MMLPAFPTTALLEEIALTQGPVASPSLVFYALSTGLIVGFWLLGRAIDETLLCIKRSHA